MAGPLNLPFLVVSSSRHQFVEIQDINWSCSEKPIDGPWEVPLYGRQAFILSPSVPEARHAANTTLERNAWSWFHGRWTPGVSRGCGTARCGRKQDAIRADWKPVLVSIQGLLLQIGCILHRCDKRILEMFDC